MPNILDRNVRFLLVGQSLHLANSQFAYPPFVWYDYDIPPSVKITRPEVRQHNTDRGWHMTYTEEFTFTEVGEFHITIRHLKYGTCTREAQKTYNIKVIVV